MDAKQKAGFVLEIVRLWVGVLQGRRCTSVVKYLPSMQQALGFLPCGGGDRGGGGRTLG
jgi:hypothetical protein